MEGDCTHESREDDDAQHQDKYERNDPSDRFALTRYAFSAGSSDRLEASAWLLLGEINGSFVVGQRA